MAVVPKKERLVEVLEVLKSYVLTFDSFFQYSLLGFKNLFLDLMFWYIYTVAIFGEGQPGKNDDFLTILN